jgi:hypothetical protein
VDEKKEFVSFLFKLYQREWGWKLLPIKYLLRFFSRLPSLHPGASALQFLWGAVVSYFLLISFHSTRFREETRLWSKLLDVERRMDFKSLGIHNSVHTGY